MACLLSGLRAHHAYGIFLSQGLLGHGGETHPEWKTFLDSSNGVNAT